MNGARRLNPVCRHAPGASAPSKGPLADACARSAPRLCQISSEHECVLSFLLANTGWCNSLSAFFSFFLLQDVPLASLGILIALWCCTPWFLRFVWFARFAGLARFMRFCVVVAGLWLRTFLVFVTFLILLAVTVAWFPACTFRARLNRLGRFLFLHTFIFKI